MNQPMSYPAASRASSARVSSLSEAKDTIDLGAIFQTLWRGKWLIITAIIFMMLLGGYYAYRIAVPIYQSTAVVIMNSRPEQVVDLESVVGGLSSDSATVNTEVEVLRSRSLLEKVVDELDLMQDPEFNSRLRSPSWSGELRNTISGLLGKSPARASTSSDEEQKRLKEAVVTSLRGHISVSVLPLSLVFQVTVQSEDAAKAAQIADSLVSTYVNNQREVKFDATEQATQWLNKRVSELQSDLEVAEQRVKTFRANTTLIDEETLAAKERQQKELEDRIVSAKADLEKLESRVSAMQAAQTPAEQAEASGDELIIRMLDSSGQPSNQSLFDARFQQELSRNIQMVARSKNQLQALQTSSKAQQVEISKQSSDLIQLQQLTREAEASKTLYEYFLTRYKETSVQRGMQQSDSRIISNAVTPSVPSEPRKSLILIMSMFLGFAIGTALVLIRELRHRAFRTAHEMESYTSYAVMGQIPMLPVRRRKDALQYFANKPTSAAAEAVRNMRTSLLMSNVDKPPKLIMVSSSFPGEGKTTVSLALAQNLTGMGKRVLLVEGDIRRRVFQQYFDAKDHPGLISVLTGVKSLEEAIFSDEIIGCDVLTSERSTANAADLFTSEKFRGLLDACRNLYDMIIIDTPPVLVVPDARIIAPQCDARLLVVKWDQTEKEQVLDALQMFESVNAPVTGLALNQINPNGMKRYGYGRGYGGSYGRYGHKYYNN